MTSHTPALATSPVRARRKTRVKRSPMVIVALLPFLIFCIALGAVPLAQVVRMSFSQITLKPGGFLYAWNGFANYVEVLSTPDGWRAMLNTIIFIVATVAGSLLVGLIAALLVNRAVVMLPIARNVLIWPAVIAPVVVSLMWLLLLSPTAGGINKVLETFGIPTQEWLNSGGGAMASLIIVDIWHWTPVVFLFLYTALQSIGDEIVEAGRIDGAASGQLLRFITLPMIAPAIGAVAVIRVIMGVKVFDEMYLLTAGGPDGATTLVSQRIQLWFFDSLKFGDASAYSIVVVVITALILGVFLFVRSRRERRAS
jgi:multiple sugar transport system permease protein